MAFSDISSPKTFKSAPFSIATTGTVVSAVSGKRIKVYAYKYVADSNNMTLNWRDGTNIALEGSQSHDKGGGAQESVEPPNFLFATTEGNSLDLVVAGGSINGRVSYWNDDST